jgi:hypothetical protein
VIVLVPLAVALVLVVAWSLWRRGTAPLGPPAGAVMAALDVPDTAATRELLGRWRDRARRWRTVAAVPAVALAVVGSVRVRGRLDIGLVDTVGTAPLWTDPLLMGLLAITLGGLAAELHHLRRVPAGPRSADLRPRDVGTLRRRRSRVRRGCLVVLLGAAVVGHVALVVPGHAPGSVGSLVVAAAVLLLAEAVERRIAVRPREALPSELTVADDAVRRAAVRSVDDTASSAVLLLLGWASLGMASLLPETQPYAAVAVVASLTVLGLSLWWAWRSAPGRLLPAGGHPRQPLPTGALRP